MVSILIYVRDRTGYQETKKSTRRLKTMLVCKNAKRLAGKPQGEERGLTRNRIEASSPVVRLCGKEAGEEGGEINLSARKLVVAASLVKNGQDAGGACG